MSQSTATSESLSVQSFDGAWLAGTLELPRGELNALLVPVHGSFCQTRDGNADAGRHWMFPHAVPARNLFVDLRDVLIPLGVGIYRYDKRASGQSEGIWARTDFHDIARDVATVLKVLQARFPALPIGLMGQSEGSLTCLKAMELGSTPAFFIAQAGALENYISLIDRQRERAAKPFLSEPNGESAHKYPLLAGFYQAYFNGTMRREIMTGTAPTHEIFGPAGWRATLNIDLIRQYDQFNPQQVLERFAKPSLLMNGTADLNVPTSALETILQAQAADKRFAHVECRILDGLEHSFRRVTAGENVFDAMRKPVDPMYRQVIADFVRRRVLGQPR